MAAGIVSQVARVGVAGLATTGLLAYLFILSARIRYPYELEWIEGAVVDHVGRILSGQPLYTAPSMEFVPLIYAPFYFYLSAIVAKVTGLGFFPLRMVSAVSSIVVFVLMYTLVRRESGSRFAGFLSVGIFAATFRFAGAWLDIGRIDSLAMALVLSAAVWVRFGTSRLADCAAVVALVLAFHTKQSAAAAAVVLAVYVLLAKRQSALLFIGGLALLTGVSVWGLSAAHGSWYSYYVYDLPSEHPVRTGQVFDFWWTDFLKPLPVLIVLGTAFLAREWLRGDKQRFLFYFLLAGGLVGSSWLPRMHFGAWDNNRIPACVALSLLAGLAIGTYSAVKTWQGARASAVELVTAAAVAGQFALIGYQPQNQVPARADREAGDGLVKALREVRGDVLVLSHGHLSVLAGKHSFAHWQAIADVLRASDPGPRHLLIAEFQAAVRERRFGAILLDYPDWVTRDLGIDDHYRLDKPLFSDPQVFLSVTGVRRRPSLWYVPR